MMTVLRGFCLALIFAPVAQYISYTILVAISIAAAIGLLVNRRRLQRKWRVNVGGTVSRGFEKVEEAFRRNVVSRQEQGGAFAVYHNGQLVVDLWGGYADYAALRYRSRESTSMVYSTTKVVTAISLQLLADRGLMDYKAPVSKYWPEFGQNNKQDITVETLVCHRAGLITIRERHKLSLLRDNPTELGRLLAKQEPFWIPGTAQGYHTLTFGLYVDQLVRRIDPKGRNLAQFFHEEVAIPFDIDFVIGEPKSEYYRACRETRASFGIRFFFTTTIPTGVVFVKEAILSLIKYRAIHLLKYVGNPTDWRPRKLNDPEYREIPCGSSHGFGTARGLAKLMGILANGGSWNGKVLLSLASIKHLQEPLSSEFDRVVLQHITYGPGTTICDIKDDCQKVHKAFGHWGAGGQMAYCDPNSGVGFAYVTNYCNILHGFIKDHRYAALERALYQCLIEVNKIK